MSTSPITPSTSTHGDASCFGKAIIRPAISSDCPRIKELAALAYEPYVERMNKKPAPMIEDYAERIAEGSVSVLEILPNSLAGKSNLEADAPRIMGFIVLLPEADALLLDNVAVDPSAQGRGYGKMLMKFAEEEARKAGLSRITLYTNEMMTENLQIYPRLGYVETHRAEQAASSGFSFPNSYKP